MTTETQQITAQEFVNENENVIVRYASASHPAGKDIAILPENWTELEFELEFLDGEIDESGVWTWNGEGEPTDFGGSNLYSLWVRSDREEWVKQTVEYISYDTSDPADYVAELEEYVTTIDLDEVRKLVDLDTVRCGRFQQIESAHRNLINEECEALAEEAEETGEWAVLADWLDERGVQEDLLAIFRD